MTLQPGDAPENSARLLHAFRDDAQQFCDFIDRWRAGSCTEPYATLLRLLSNLAKSGATIPFDMADATDVGDVDRIQHDQWKTIAAEIDKRTGVACSALLNENAYDEEAQVRASMLWDDLADIYRDLRYGLDLYAVGDSEQIARAVWEWQFNYECHWGAHLFRALTTVHEIRYQLRLE